MKRTRPQHPGSWLTPLALWLALSLGGCAAAPRAVAPADSAAPEPMAPGDGEDVAALQRQVDSLMAEIALQKEQLPAAPGGDAGRPARAPGPTSPQPGKQPDASPPSEDDAAPRSGYRKQCDTVATAICASSDQICSIAARHPNDAWFSGRCLNASADCAQAQATCDSY